jgi:uncharacterized membrane protein
VDIVTMGILAALAVASIVLSVALSRRDSTMLASAHTPLDEADHILAQRYARGEISLDEYHRTRSILRR